MKKDISFYVYIMLESISYIQDYIEDLQGETFKDDKLTQDAVLRQITIIGEAAKSVPDDVRSRYLDVPWKKIAGMRDRVVHDYTRVDLDLVWEVCTEDLLPLQDRLKMILTELEEEEGDNG